MEAASCTAQTQQAASHSSAETHTDDTPGVAPARPRRGSWTAEEQRAYWRQKKQLKRQRDKAAAMARKVALQEEWTALSAAEQARRREVAAVVHAQRHAAEAALRAACAQNLSRASLPVLVFDLSFAWCMTLADTRSTVAQIKYGYSALRHAAFPLRPVITSTMGKEVDDTAHDATASAQLLATLHTYDGFRAYPPVVTHDAHWSTLYSRDKVVYLTADAADALRDVDEDTVYVLGAFVDHNRYKGLTHSAAARHGVRTAHLPLQENLVLGNRCKVLTINHVVEVLTRYMTSAQRDWRVALEGALPTRRVKEGEAREKRARGVASDAPSNGSSPASSAL